MKTVRQHPHLYLPGGYDKNGNLVLVCSFCGRGCEDLAPELHVLNIEAYEEVLRSKED